MGESGFVENEIEGQTGLAQMFDEIPEVQSLLDGSLFSDGSNNPSPGSFSLSIDDMEQMLMDDDVDNEQMLLMMTGKGDDNEEGPRGDQQQPSALDFPPDDFFSDLFRDSPVESDLSFETVDVTTDCGKNPNPNPSEERERIDVDVDVDVDVEQEQEQGENNGDVDDPNSKKRKRQLRNRDAAVRSRERKKMYVRDLEMKSRYLEGECKRLGMLLQCCFAENQALRLSLHNAKASDASMTKQESAVLLLESLLLGSLLWFLGIVCLFILPGPLQSNLEAVPPENADKKNQGSLAVRKAGSKLLGHQVLKSFMVSKRCKASRSRMKPNSFVLEVLV